MRFVAQALGDDRLDLRVPVRQPDVIEALPQCRQVNETHLMATIETKLK